VKTNCGAQYALMMIDLYPALANEAATYKALAQSRGELVSNLQRGESNARSEAATLRQQADIERKAWAARLVKNSAMWAGIGAGGGVVLTAIIISAIRK